MGSDLVIEVVSNAIFVILKVAAPPLIMGLAVGIIVSIFQAVTSIQEQTLAFVPKILAVFLSLVIFGNWMLTELTGFLHYAFETLSEAMLLL